MQIWERVRRWFQPLRNILGDDPEAWEDIQAWRRQLVRGILRVLLVLGGLVLAITVYGTWQRGNVLLVGVYVFIYLLLVGLMLWKSAPYALHAGGILALMYAVGLSDLFNYGWQQDVRLFFLAMAILAALFFSVRMGLLILVLAILTLAGFGVALVSGMVTLPPVTEPLFAGTQIPISLVSDSAVLILLGLLLIVVQNYLMPYLAQALTQSRVLAKEMEEERQDLELRAQAIREVNYALQRRVMQLEAGAEVGRTVASIFDLEQLLNRTTVLISEGFGFYHTGIFLLDETGETAILRAASSEGGRKMVADGHQLRRGEGMVGWVIENRQSRIALDVGEDAVHFANPNLPATRSEVALPLLVGGRLIGVLNVQSTEERAFDQDDVRSLESLTGQLAVAIENARRVSEEAALLEATSPFYRLARRFATANTPRDVYVAILDTVSEYMPQRAFIIMLGRDYPYIAADLRAGQMHFPQTASELMDAEQLAVLVALGQALTLPLIIPDVADPPDIVSREQWAQLGLLAQRFEVRSAALVPIRVEERVLGVLFTSFRERHGFSSAEERLYRTLSDMSGVALQRLQLVRDTQLRIEQERRLRVFSDEMLGIMDLPTMVTQAATALRTLIDADGVLVALEQAALTEEEGN